MPSAFLDSSTLIELTFRHREIRKKVSAALPSDLNRSTSRYVVFEVARGYLGHLILLHNKALAVQSLSELHEYLHSGAQIFKRYRSGTMLGAFDDFIVHLETLDQSLTEDQRLAAFQGWIASHLRRGWQKLLHGIEVINPVGCQEDMPAPKRNRSQNYEQALPKEQCGSAAACGLDAYLTSHQSDFQNIVASLDGLERIDAETKRRIAALRRLLDKGSGRDFDGKDCWACGDAIICHEAPADSTVVSKNRKHFQPLCSILNKKFIAYK